MLILELPGFSSESSRVKQTALELLSIIDKLAAPHITNPLVEKFWNWFFVSHGKKIVQNMNDQELKEIMKSGYDALKPIYEKTDIAVQLKEAEQYNDKKTMDRLKKLPGFQEILELIE